MNGKLIFKMIDDYILGKFDIKKLDNYFQFKNKVEDFDEDLLHISEYSDRNAGVQPDTFAMRFSRV
ncbi:hypothetical protein, partial [Aliarcobacter butzleri]|uniref:hypothetical protein n=1 Tax=Aliarcobacter butzleri TaxID=28197 RepID=UPI001EDB1898